MSAASTRGVIEAHFAAFNRHDTAALLQGMAEEIVWAIGTDTFLGKTSLSDLFDDWLWSTDPHIDVLRLVVDGHEAAAECVEYLTLAGSRKSLPMGVFFEASDCLLRSAKVFREGTADVSMI